MKSNERLAAGLGSAAYRDANASLGAARGNWRVNRERVVSGMETEIVENSGVCRTRRV